MARAKLKMLAMVVAGVIAGCNSHDPPLPQYSLDLSNAQVIKVLRDRTHAVRTMSGEGLLTLTRPYGESVRLDMAIAMQPPGRVRVRAWKFGQAVFDVTINDMGVYLLTPEQSSRADQMKTAGVSASQLARTWSLLTGGFFDAPPDTVQQHGNILEMRRTIERQVIACEVDRSTLTPARYRLLDPEDRSRFTIKLDHYEIVNGTPWAKHLTADSESGKIAIILRTLEINRDIDANAFKPPRRAEKLQ